jgi:subtilisin family serine protease
LLHEIATAFRKTGLVEAAYVKPPSEPPLNNMQPAAAAAPAATPSFVSRQGYLGVAPGGIDAAFAWTQPGGQGTNVNIVDVEGAWRLTHEKLSSANNLGLLSGSHSPDVRWRNHGTAVVGLIGATQSNFGVTGICPDARVGVIGIFPESRGSSVAIREAADNLNGGDILLIELHRAHPRYEDRSRLDQFGCIAVEWWPDDFDAIRYAVNRGIIVVEAAGNGDQNLDDLLYETPDPGFPNDWENPFRRANRDSGAILVGAGAPPPQPQGSNHGPDRSRLKFSNYGSAVDVQGWGEEVTTCGYGDLQGGADGDRWYTAGFSGTSSASPIVVGALGCVQGVRRARAQALLTPPTARALLRSTGSPQEDAPGRPRTQRIGNRPDLRQMIAAPIV